jgi:acylphosphatase
MDQGEETSDADRLTRGYIISGRVQGVGFRFFVLHRAQAAGVTGWVRNLSTGQVEVQATGTPEQQLALEHALWKGPRFSSVTDVEKTDRPDEVDSGTDFLIID